VPPELDVYPPMGNPPPETVLLSPPEPSPDPSSDPSPEPSSYYSPVIYEISQSNPCPFQQVEARVIDVNSIKLPTKLKGELWIYFGAKFITTEA